MYILDVVEATGSRNILVAKLILAPKNRIKISCRRWVKVWVVAAFSSPLKAPNPDDFMPRTAKSDIKNPTRTFRSIVQENQPYMVESNKNIKPTILQLNVDAFTSINFTVIAKNI
ncbi:unnamed protein product [Clavelina lepadiformis]|uniref:Uncharacterized protein n=1 Tax=Clavelina lepadiformis TaxID=159417 RepID=A0ABP0FSW4_CLALP